MSHNVALVTDSTAMLSPEIMAERDITAVPLMVVVDSASYDEGRGEITAEVVADVLRTGRTISTSRPTPGLFLEAYEASKARGAREVLSIHLSGEMSGTYDSARLAARSAPLPVRVVDTRQLGMATGYAVLTAADVLDAGGTAEEAAGAALARAGATTSLFYVDTLEHLRRGGRIGAAAALLCSALAVKPLLEIVDGRVATKEKVRTSARALNRLEELAVTAAGEDKIDLTVAHLGNRDGARLLAARLAERLGSQLAGRDVTVGEVGAVIGAHVGPGMVAVVVAPH